MNPLVIAIALAASTAPALAEPRYSASYFNDLRALGLEREAFLYALNWAASSDPDAESAVSYALLDGKGVDANPMAAIALACRSTSMAFACSFMNRSNALGTAEIIPVA
jgi:hypothetical protein